MFFWDQGSFSFIYPKISAFREKLRYFEITLKIFFTVYSKISSYRKKRDHFEKIVFCAYLRKYQRLGVHYLRSL